jgi:hypothetical protein
MTHQECNEKYSVMQQFVEFKKLLASSVGLMEE